MPDQIIDQLVMKIEILRTQLHELVLAKGINDPAVLALSQVLDEVINDYNRLQLKRRKHNP